MLYMCMCISRKMPEQALGGMPLCLRLVKEINLQNFHVSNYDVDSRMMKPFIDAVKVELSTCFLYQLLKERSTS